MEYYPFFIDFLNTTQSYKSIHHRYLSLSMVWIWALVWMEPILLSFHLAWLSFDP
jgi:hypothetical protein